ELQLLSEMTLETADNQPLDAKRWPQWRGLRRDGVTTAADLLVSWPSNGPGELWRVKGGDGYSSFAVSKDTAFSVVVVGQDQEAVVAWNLATGEVRWRHTYDRGRTFEFEGPLATPTLANGRLYAVSPAGRLMCLDGGTGDPHWQIDLVSELGGRPPRWGFS